MPHLHLRGLPVLFLAAAASLPVIASEVVQPTHATIAELRQNAADESAVAFHGTVVRRVGDDAYLLSDASGEIKVDAWVEGRGAVPMPVGERVLVRGVMDIELGQREVYLGSFVPAPEAHGDKHEGEAASVPEAKPAPGDVSTIQHIRKHAREGEQVALTGTVVKRRGDDAYIVQDATGRIRVETWIEGRGNVALPVGETVTIHGHADRRFLLPTEVYLHEFTVHGDGDATK